MSAHPQLPGHHHPAGVSELTLPDDNKARGLTTGIDERIHTLHDDPAPFRWICKLKIFFELEGEKVEWRDLSNDWTDKTKEKVVLEEPMSYIAKHEPGTASDQDTIGYGTGFLVNIPESTRCIVWTAAHNLCFSVKGSKFGNAAKDKERDYWVPINRVIITFPGNRAPFVVKAEHMWYPPKYTSSELTRIERLKYDFGLIVLPNRKEHNTDCGFGYSATLTDRQLLSGLSLSIFGYPMRDAKAMESSQKVHKVTDTFETGEKVGQKKTKEEMEAEWLEKNQCDDRILYGSGGPVQSVTGRKLRYFVHTSRGQSGCPVYIWDNGVYTVVGIQ